MTGYANARVLVIAPNARRRDWLADMIGEADECLAPRFWIAEKTILEEASPSHPGWRRRGGPDLRPLFSPSSGMMEGMF